MPYLMNEDWLTTGKRINVLAAQACIELVEYDKDADLQIDLNEQNLEETTNNHSECASGRERERDMDSEHRFRMDLLVDATESLPDQRAIERKR